MLLYNKPIRLTQEEMVTHSEFKNFGVEAGKHPPMRGWVAAPLNDTNGTNWGLIQLSDKLEGDYPEDDEALLSDFIKLISTCLELAWSRRNYLKQLSHS